MRDIRDFDILVLPGWHGSAPDHWQSLWEGAFPNMRRVEQDDWEEPVYARWAGRLDAAVGRRSRPLLLVAHSLGTSLVMRWAAGTGHARGVAGAFLVAPSDRDRFEVPGQGPRGFAPMVLAPLPFPSMVVASSTDERVGLDRARVFAEAWGSVLVEAGPLGHMGSAARLGIWPYGLVLLGGFVASLPDAT